MTGHTLGLAGHTLGVAFMALGGLAGLVSILWSLLWRPLMNLGEKLGWL